MRTVFAVIPAAAAAERAVAGFQALPLADNPKLVGLHVAPLTITYGLGADVALAAYIETQIAAADQEREEAEAAFSRACQKEGITFEWRAERSPDSLVSPHAGSMARAADIILAPQLPKSESIGVHELEEVVLAAGRPVIALPAGWSDKSLGARAVVAWDGGREATRAVFDALPILLGAEAVKIVSVQGVISDPVRQFTPGDDIAATLSRHGIPVETASVRSTHSSVKEELDAQAVDFGATLTVMGCYGHSRFRERILGGVSRDMLKEVSAPLLLSS
jgi:nucleotide-binding universal stress UspA family protein